MKKVSFSEELSSSTYPGRGLMIGRSSDGKSAVAVYFIMGRSVNSRNRIFVNDGDGIHTQAFDPSKLSDPSLIIYAPVRVRGNDTIVTNGDQTDTIYDGMTKGLTFEQSLRSRKFEPDDPNFTPRISSVIKRQKNNFSYEISILKSADGDGSSCSRFTFSYDVPMNGEGHYIHTYIDNGEPLPSFDGEPTRVSCDGSIDDFTDSVWNSLNSDNKVSLFVRYIDLETGNAETRIKNKNV